MTHIKTIPAVFNLMDRFFQDELTPQTAYRPAVNILENEQSYQLELLAPGLNKADFQLQLSHQQLTISYEKKEATDASTEQFIRREFNTRSFKRTFDLTNKINTEAIEATYENGILRIVLPKTAPIVNKIKTLSIQ